MNKTLYDGTGEMAKTQKKPKQIRSGTAVTAWLSDEEIIKLDALVERVRLDRSKVFKLFINLYAPDELLARYMEDLAKPGKRAEGDD